MRKPERPTSDTSLDTPFQTLRASLMMACVVSDGRLFGFKPSEWAILLVGVELCGFVTLLY